MKLSNQKLFRLSIHLLIQEFKCKFNFQSESQDSLSNILRNIKKLFPKDNSIYYFYYSKQDGIRPPILSEWFEQVIAGLTVEQFPTISAALGFISNIPVILKIFKFTLILNKLASF